MREKNEAIIKIRNSGGKSSQISWIATSTPGLKVIPSQGAVMGGKEQKIIVKVEDRERAKKIKNNAVFIWAKSGVLMERRKFVQRSTIKAIIYYSV